MFLGGSMSAYVEDVPIENETIPFDELSEACPQLR
jgi:hypothetical protein